MKAATLVPVEEYLRTSYRPDRDYVDGEVVEETWASTITAIYRRSSRIIFERGVSSGRCTQWSSSAYRSGRLDFVFLTFALFRPVDPTLVFIASRLSSASKFFPKKIDFRGCRERIDDYLKFGVRYVWLIDPAKERRAWVYTTEGRREVRDGMLRTEDPTIEVSLAEVYAGLGRVVESLHPIGGLKRIYS